ncbi:MAG: M48 family metallopeptidase [Bacteroidales bacterium]|nr:M48 family metallopeptidase [Bacteroidales bacterium]
MEPLRNYKIIFSRRRSISIILSPGKEITVRAPYRTSLKTIDRFVQEKAKWIEANLKKYSETENLNRGQRYLDGELHLFSGRKYVLKITESDRPFVRLHENILETGVTHVNDSGKIRSMLELWYLQKAREILPLKLKDTLAKFPHHAFSPSGLVVRRLKSRWGSCTSKRKITLNSELIKLDPALVEYVIIHELCHLKHHNHGKDFYNLLEELVPDYKSLRKELRKFILV